MDVSSWYTQGFALAAQAVEADNAKDYRKAFDLYSRSLDHIIAGLKCALQRAESATAVRMAELLGTPCATHFYSRLKGGIRHSIVCSTPFSSAASSPPPFF
jgi:MIT (microtubule interacting and transport) domain